MKRAIPSAQGFLGLTDELVNSPLTTGKTILVDLCPDSSLTSAGGRNVDSDGALVGGGNNIVTAAVVVPLESELITSLYRNRLGDLAIVDVTVDRICGDILNRVVVRGGTNVDITAYLSRLASL